MINNGLSAFEYTAASLAGRGRSSRNPFGPALGITFAGAISVVLWVVLVHAAAWAARAIF